MTLEVLDGLGHLHRSGIIHRDLKPANILRIDGKWKLADFGLATNDLTEVTTAGTIGYLAPNGPLGQSADLYAIGKILYSMLTGQGVSKFPSIGDSLEAVSDRERFGRILRVVNRACHHLPEQRFDSVPEFRAALTVAADHAQIRRRQQIRWGTITATLVAAAFLLGYQLTRPEPIGVGTVIEHTTLPHDIPEDPETGNGSEYLEKPGGQPMRAVVMHDKTWPESVGGTGHRYLALLVTPDADNWAVDDAEAIASELGGYLVSLNTPEENMWVFMNLANDRALWRSYVTPASGRFVDGEFETDDALQIPELDQEAREYYKLYAKPEWRELESQGRPMLPSIKGPLIGLRYWNGEFRWSDGSPLEYSAWLPVQPYVTRYSYVGFLYANEESLALTPQWARTSSYGNPHLDEQRNRYISFIVEIPR